MNTRAYLEQMVEIRKNSNLRPMGVSYSCLEDFVLKEGKEFKYSPRPDSIPKKKDNYCFQNSFEVARKHNLSYVEGFANAGIVMLHAWCVDKSGVVVDPTWNKGSDYFGVVIPAYLMYALVLNRGKYGILDDWENRWPVLRFGLPELLKQMKKNRNFLKGLKHAKAG